MPTPQQKQEKWKLVPHLLLYTAGNYVHVSRNGEDSGTSTAVSVVEAGQSSHYTAQLYSQCIAWRSVKYVPYSYILSFIRAMSQLGGQ